MMSANRKEKTYRDLDPVQKLHFPGWLYLCKESGQIIDMLNENRSNELETNRNFVPTPTQKLDLQDGLYSGGKKK